MDKLDDKKRDLIQGDFEKYMRFQVQSADGFDFESFVAFGASLLNFYVGSSLLLAEEKQVAAQYLSFLFNGGIQNRIELDDLKQLSDFIHQDEALDYQVLSPIFL